MRDKAQWEQIITLIHKVEDRYGSIHNTPRSGYGKILPQGRGVVTAFALTK